MKNKLYILVSIVLIAFVVIASYTPKVVQAEMVMQEEPATEGEDVLYEKGPEPQAEEPIISTDIDTPDFFEEDPSKPFDDNQVNLVQYDFFNAVGINFVPHDSAITHYNAANGCLGSTYTGTYAKTFSVPVNLPHGAKGSNMYFTYWNGVENPGGMIEVTLFRRKYDSLTTEKVKNWGLAKTPSGAHFSTLAITDVTFNTSYWLYWFEFKLPASTTQRMFCGIQIAYSKPPIFPLAFPGVMTRP